MSPVIKSFVLFFVVLIAACGRAPESKVDLQVEENKAIARRRFEEIWNQGKLDIIDEIYAANYVGHMSGSPDIHGPEGFKQFVTMQLTAFPDTKFTIEDQIAEGEKVVIRWKYTGTHQGEFMGIHPPTGMQVTGTGISILYASLAVRSWKTGTTGTL